LRDFLVAPVADRLHTFLAHEAELVTEHHLRSSSPTPVSAEAWHAADERERFYRFATVVGVKPDFSSSGRALLYLLFLSALADPRLIAYFEELWGRPLALRGPFGGHCMRPDDVLASHSDNADGRRVSLVFHLSGEWLPHYGGALQLRSKRGRTARIEPEHNTMVAFDVQHNAEHYVEPIARGAPPRLAIAGFYFDAQ
jgi:Rps23 Pro-64 3,4-dihydroxylase Tpa1-like proline 4-hydroxylase